MTEVYVVLGCSTDDAWVVGVFTNYDNAYDAYREEIDAHGGFDINCTWWENVYSRTRIYHITNKNDNSHTTIKLLTKTLN